MPFADNQGQVAPDSFTEKGAQLRGDHSLTVSTPLLGGLAQTLGTSRCSVNVCRLKAGWGSISQSETLSHPGGAQALLPMGEPIRGCGSRPSEPAPPGAQQWPAPGPGLRSLVLPCGTVHLQRWETCWEVRSPGKRAVLWMAGKASSSTDTVPGTL